MKYMNRKLMLYSLLVLVMIVPMACRSLNQVTPEALDDAAIEAEVRAKIAEDVTSKTFAVEVDVKDGVVTLSGHAGSADERRRIADAANDVRGVRSVINNIHVNP
jgi:osmotically-inducible protein OsmY